MPVNLNPVMTWLSGAYLYVIAGLSAALLVMGVGCYIQGQRMHGWKVEARAEKAGRKADRGTYEQAQREAELLALAQRKNLETKYDTYKQEADRNYADLRRHFDAALMRYKAAQGASRKPRSLPAAPAPGPGGPEGGSQDPVVPVQMSDLSICAENTAKALIAREWAKKIEAAQIN